jgi:hypothetical protein
MAGLTFQTPQYVRAAPPATDEAEESTLRAKNFTHLLALSMADSDEIANLHEREHEITEKTLTPPDFESARWLPASELRSEPRTEVAPPPSSGPTSAPSSAPSSSAPSTVPASRPPPLPSSPARRPALAFAEIPPALMALPVTALTPDDGIRAIKKRVWLQAAMTSIGLFAAALLVLGISSAAASPARAEAPRAPAAYVASKTFSCIDDMPSRARTPQRVSTPTVLRPAVATRTVFTPRTNVKPKIAHRGNIVRVAPF